jgi:hypothetical protein
MISSFDKKLSMKSLWKNQHILSCRQKLSLEISEAKHFFSQRNFLKLQMKITAMGKLTLTACIFLLVVGMYAYNITSSSTKWYFFNKKMNEHKELMFQQSIKKSDILLLEKQLWEKVSVRTPSRDTRKNDTISVVTSTQELTKR